VKPYPFQEAVVSVKQISGQDAVFFSDDGKPELKVGGSRGKPKADTFMGAAKLQRTLDLEADKGRVAGGLAPEVIGSVCIFEGGKKCWKAGYDLRNHKGRGKEVIITKGGELATGAQGEKEGGEGAGKKDNKTVQDLKAEYAKANSVEAIKKWAFPLKPRA
jgi:hypothetical protein